MRLLLVDDDLAIAELLEITLAKYSPIIATDLPTALSYLDAREFDLVVTDFHLTGSDTSLPIIARGFPTILMSGGLREEEMTQMLSAYPNLIAFIKKPFVLKELKAIISGLE